MNKLEMIDVYTPKTVRWGGGKISLEELKKDIERLESEGINVVSLEIYDYDSAHDDRTPYIKVETYIRRPITEKELHDREAKKQNELIKKEEAERILYQELKLKYKDL